MIYYILALLVVVSTSVGNLLLKMVTNRVTGSGLRLYIHPLSILAFLIFAIVVFLSIYSMKGLDLKVFFALNSLTYICIPFLSFVFLKESVTRNKLIGIIIISVGVIIFNF